MLRTLLFVPALEKRLAKIPTIGADAFVVDLEDSIPEQEKDAALVRAVDFIRTYEGAAPCFFRVDRSRMEEEVRALSVFSRVSGFMIPKFEDPCVLEPLAETIGGKKIIALVETPLGLVELRRIASSSRVSALALGAEDLTCALNAVCSYESILFARSRTVAFAKAFNKRVYDTPCLNYTNEAELEREASASAALGFDGKLAIHPAQLPILARAFGPRDPETLRKIVREFERNGENVLVFDGRIYERPHIARIKNILGSIENDELF